MFQVFYCHSKSWSLYSNIFFMKYFRIRGNNVSYVNSLLKKHGMNLLNIKLFCFQSIQLTSMDIIHSRAQDSSFIIWIFLPPAYKVRREGNIFSLSVHQWGGGEGTAGGTPVRTPSPHPVVPQEDCLVGILYLHLVQLLSDKIRPSFYLHGDPERCWILKI